MSKNDYIIRLERKEEQREVEFLVRESFWNVYRPGCLEHYVLNQLRDDADFIPELNFVMEKEEAKEFRNRLLSFLEYAVPLYCSEGKSQLVIAVGCTGGKHRSVVFAELISKYLKDKNYRVSVVHRDISK